MDTVLTSQQQSIYDFVSSQIETFGRPPTRAEIAQRMGFRSGNAAQEHLQALARKGLVILSRQARGIQLVNRKPNSRVQLVIQRWEKELETHSPNCFDGVSLRALLDELKRALE